MTTTRYLRRARVEIGVSETARLVIEDLGIAFELRLESQPDSSPSNIKIYNLARDTERRIEKGQALSLYAGYGMDQNLDLLHQGEIVRVEQERTGLERITMLQLGNPKQTQITGAIYFRGKRGLTPLRDIVAELVATMDLTLGSTNDLPDVRIENYSYGGKAAEALTRLLRPRGVEWYVENEEVLFASGQAASSTLPEFLLNEAAGLIGSPSRTENGARAKMLLTNLIRRNQRVRIKSELVTGLFKANVITHKGDTWGGEWITEIEATHDQPQP